MPPIRQINIEENQLSFTGSDGIEQTLDYTDVLQDDVATAENWINDWLGQNANFTMLCHVFSVNPLLLTIGAFDEAPIESSVTSAKTTVNEPGMPSVDVSMLNWWE